MKVSAYMTQRLVTVTPEMGARSTFYMMLANGIRHMPVVEGRQLVGFISDRDLRRPGWVDQGGDSAFPYALTDDMRVGDLMTTDVRTLRASDRLSKAVSLFKEHRYGALPVVNKDGELVGILSVYDLMGPLETYLDAERTARKSARSR